jgi:Leucine-rich repeat (LRR) protein
MHYYYYYYYYCFCFCLGTLILSDNEFHGQLTNRFQTMSRLGHLDLDGNRFNSTLEEILNCGNCTSTLTKFSSWQNPLSGDIPEWLFEFSMLSSLSITKSKLTGTIPSGFGRLTALNHLNLAENYYFSGTTNVLPTEMGRLTNLQALLVSDSVVGGTIPLEFSNLSSLKTLGIVRTSLTGSIANEICAIDGLETIRYSDGVNCSCPGNVCDLLIV